MAFWGLSQSVGSLLCLLVLCTVGVQVHENETDDCRKVVEFLGIQIAQCSSYVYTWGLLLLMIDILHDLYQQHRNSGSMIHIYI